MLYESSIQKANLIMTLRSMGISSDTVLSAIEYIPREIFLPSNFHSYAYQNNPLPIGFNQTISQPFIVAVMTEALDLKGNEIVLEIGTGSGYQTSILSLLSRRVYSIERLKPLLVNALTCFKKLKLTNIVAEAGDGLLGWPKLAPFDRIIITCAIKKLDKRLLDQIRFNGICIAPVEDLNSKQRLKKIIIKKNRTDDLWEDLGEVSFVPLISDND
ncbi:protein-L-isoaspartate(D-aspartate) O-methyltransferase [Alphaproteobacteria bacterium]|nr:protein-L-isoaspartate(D-aspartate) O-methyltransferase [Alphaproteobacteria bacterium]